MVFAPLRVGSRCWALISRDGSKKQIVTFDARHPEPRHWEPILSDLPTTMNQCTIWDEAICITSSTGDTHMTAVYDLTGKKVDDISYPLDGTVQIYPRRGSPQKGIYYKYSSFVCPPVIRQYDLESRCHRAVSTENVPFIPKAVETHRTTYRSGDETRVPICVAWDPAKVSCGPGPLIFTAYGGFGVKITPAYSTFVTFLLEQGFRFAFANVRGGAELGPAWYEAGRRHNKPQTISDFIAGADWLIAKGFTTSNQMATFGGSNGGLLVAAAMVRRPDLFRATLCIAAILDMLRYHEFDLTYRWIDEYGSSDDPDDFAVLRSYSPYHAIQQGRDYPSVLFVTGEADNRCNPLHTRKMVARLQAESSGRNPVLADISPIRGHSPTLPLHIRVDALTDRLAFICNELGVRVHNKA
jgi:prolyl oligopeptidase